VQKKKKKKGVEEKQEVKENGEEMRINMER